MFYHLLSVLLMSSSLALGVCNVVDKYNRVEQNPMTSVPFGALSNEEVDITIDSNVDNNNTLIFRIPIGLDLDNQELFIRNANNDGTYQVPSPYSTYLNITDYFTPLAIKGANNTVDDYILDYSHLCRAYYNIFGPLTNDEIVYNLMLYKNSGNVYAYRFITYGINLCDLGYLDYFDGTIGYLVSRSYAVYPTWNYMFNYNTFDVGAYANYDSYDYQTSSVNFDRFMFVSNLDVSTFPTDSLVCYVNYYLFYYTSTGYTTGYQKGYTDGYNDGKIDGYNLGNKDGYTNGYNDGKDVGYQQGKTDGINQATPLQLNFLGLFGAIADTPVYIIRNLFSFEILGINALAVFMSLLTALLVIHFVRKLL